MIVQRIKSGKVSQKDSRSMPILFSRKLHALRICCKTDLKSFLCLFPQTDSIISPSCFPWILDYPPPFLVCVKLFTAYGILLHHSSTILVSGIIVPHAPCQTLFHLQIFPKLSQTLNKIPQKIWLLVHQSVSSSTSQTFQNTFPWISQ